MEYRAIFDTIPEQFDRYRPRYCPELFDCLIREAQVGPDKTVLELGPGTGQATEPILRTGCDYHAIELGEHLAEKMRSKFGHYPNFHIVRDDFITHDFGDMRFDLIYSAATLRPGGTLAMMLTNGDYRAPNEALYQKIQEVYSAWFRPETEYRRMHGPFSYEHAVDYGFTDLERREFPGRRVLTADQYVALCGTHSDHLVIPEPYRTPFFEGLRNAVEENGGKVVFEDTYVLYLARKPQDS